MKEPLLHIVKRTDMIWWKAWLIRLAAILAAFLVSALVTLLLTGLNPLEVFRALFYGAFGTHNNRMMLLQKAAILLCIGLAVTPAFRMRFWNTGAEGQVLAGAMAAGAVMKWGASWHPALLFAAMFLSAILSGAVWGLIPAIFKAKWNTNETLFTLMMNYVAIQIVRYFNIVWADPPGSGKINVINLGSKAGWLPKLFGENYVIVILFVAVLTALVFVYLRYTKHGYEISVVGESVRTARYIGINVKKVILRTMILSGAIAGLAGFFLVSGIDHTVMESTAGGQGFTAILISWLAKFNPVGMIFSSLLVVFLGRGSKEITTMFHLNEVFSEILVGIILLFVIGCEFFIQYRIVFRKRGKEGASDGK